MAVRVTRAGVGLTIGIIVLGLLVLGGLNLVKQRGEQARRDEAIQVAEQNLESESETGTLSPDATDSDTNETAGTDTTGGTNSNGGDVSTTTSGELPETGPNDLAALFVVGLLTFAGVSYIVSRRKLHQLDF